MDVTSPRDASAAFSHYDTVNGKDISIEVMAEGLDALDGQFNLTQSDSKNKDSFKAFASGSPIVMDEKSAGDITAAATADAGASTAFTSAAHGIPDDGDTTTVTIEGTDDYNGTFEATYVDANTFKISVAFVDDQTGTWKRKVYKQLKVTDFVYRYIKAIWAPGAVSEGVVQVKVKTARPEGPFN